MNRLTEEQRIKVQEVMKDYNQNDFWVKIFKKFKTSPLTMNLLTLLIIFLLIFLTIFSPGMAGFALVTITIINLVFGSKKRNSQKAIKAELFSDLIKTIYDTFEYTADSNIDSVEFSDSKLCKNYYDYFNGQDGISGIVKNNQVKISKLLATQREKKGDTTVFNGVLVIVECFIKFENEVIIVSDVFDKKRIFKNSNVPIDKVDLENSEFEKIFDVFSDNQIYARRILTLAYMEKLVEISKKINKQINLSFIDNKMYIAVENMEIIPNSKLFNNIKGMSIEEIENSLNNIQEIVDIIKFLNIEENF